MMLNTIRKLPVILHEIKRETPEDKFISTTKQKIADKNLHIADIFSLWDNVLLYGERVVIPKTLQKRILKDFQAGHPGKKRVKNLMRSYVYWPKMDLDISNMVDACKGCAPTTKAPPITYKSWPKTDQPWSRIPVDFAGPMEDVYYLIVVDSCTKWPEVLWCKRPTTGVAITFLHELLARFSSLDCLISDNGTQLTSSDFKEFCDTFQIKHNYTFVPPKIQRTGRTFRRHSEERSKESLRNTLRKGFKQFLQVYRITPNPNTPDATSPAETMFARKIRSVFEKLRPKQASLGRTTTVPTKRYNPGDKVFFKAYSNNTSFGELGTIGKRTGNMTYIILGPTATHERHLNQIRRRRLDDLGRTPQDEEEAIETLYDTFDIEPPQAAIEQRRSGRKGKYTEPLTIDPQKRNKKSWEEGVMGTYPTMPQRWTRPT